MRGGDMVRAVRSSRAVRLSGLALGGAALAAAGLLAGGAHAQAGRASAGTALTAGSRHAARPAAGGTRHRAGTLPVAGALPVKDVAQATRLAGPLRGVRRYLRTREGVAQIALFNTGPPGTGKTTVALRMAELLHRLGYLEKGHLVQAMRDDLVAEYIGQTAPKTKRVLDRAMGGVLFIDEAYYLYRPGDSKDHGQEVVDILLQVMENERDKLVVILAGYKDRMEGFFGSNPGMSSRIAHHLDFAAYELDELVHIGRRMMEQSNYYLSAEAEAAFSEYLTHRMGQPRFANARSVRNELDRARLRHAHRLATELDRSWNRDDLMRIEPADVVIRA
jgi:probable Rubsico expression protein CbbX